MTNVLIVDDHIAVGIGTKAIINELEGVNVTLASTKAELSNILQTQYFDLVLMDIHLPGKNGLEWMKEIKTKSPKTKVIMYTGLDVESHFNLCLEMGADGIVSKNSSSDQIKLAVQSALNGHILMPLELVKKIRVTQVVVDNAEERVVLTEREQQVLIEVAKGTTNFQIAEMLFLSQRSVERELSSIYKKLRVASRIEAVEKGVKEGLIPEIIIK
ncbi:response regulator transcription factor [Metabacillus halosaccharovorans]|uniref:Response regulator transcription factor n=1 Tax=Metabacillus halosaccharovorans TaxID=930124 RepID=A0ABT3DGJ6_9BACI|nr:response regulator transcription factor [Metabacillus halosaccharovorans]MCV9886190.1 response regulator transcription factor [Metabacillus halosaccharovorans]